METVKTRKKKKPKLVTSQNGINRGAQKPKKHNINIILLSKYLFIKLFLKIHKNTKSQTKPNQKPITSEEIFIDIKDTSDLPVNSVLAIIRIFEAALLLSY